MKQAELELLRKALLIRRTEEALSQLFSQDLIRGTLHLCLGQEFAAATVGAHLRATDFIFSNHRGHGHYLACTEDVEGMIGELMGRATGCAGGWGGSQHLHKNGFYSSGILAGLAPVAVGSAMAQKKGGTSDISVVFLGDGALGEGVVYESLNFASLWQLPILFVVENNGIAQTTPTSEAMAGGMAERAKAFAINYERGSTWEWQALAAKAEQCVSFVREKSQPLFLEIATARLGPHSKGEETRSPKELAELIERDPLNLILKTQTPEILLFEEQIEERLKQAVEAAKRAPKAKARSARAPLSAGSKWQRFEGRSKFFAAQINSAFDQEMASDPSIIFIGEDVLSPYGGAFKIASQLSQRYPKQVISTPNSEALIAGLATGLSLHSYRPIAEFMFGDFLPLAFDQIFNHLTKFGAIHDGKSLNVILRAPVGAGRGYGPTHSQTPSKHFLGIHDLRVMSMHALLDAQSFYQSLLKKDPGPTLVLEPKALYSAQALKEAPGFDIFYCDNRHDGWIRPQSSEVDLTILCHGECSLHMIRACEALFEEHDVITQVLCVTQISPFDVRDYNEILALAPRLLIVEDSDAFSSFSSEVMAQILEQEDLRSLKVRRLHQAEGVIPAAPHLEKQMQISLEKILTAALAFGKTHLVLF
jgi:2-oxoisovalerate dehydrogenase E1 component